MMNEKRVIPIKYIGRNPTGFADRLYETGTVWKCPGDVQFVCHTDSLKLLRHNDMFSILTDEEAKVMLEGKKANSDPLSDAIGDAERAALCERERRERENLSKWDLSDTLRAEINAIVDKEELIAFALRQPETSTRAFDRRKTVENLKAEIIQTMTLSGTLQ
jgi:hypothetical protein